MKIPQLKRKLEVKKYHGYELKDEFSWVHQKDILNVLKDSSKLNPEVRKYLEEENAYTQFHLKLSISVFLFQIFSDFWV